MPITDDVLQKINLSFDTANSGSSGKLDNTN
jgi:hypothetical protein